LNGPDREVVQLRLERWTQRHLASLLEPLINMQDDEQIAGLARGFSYRLVEGLGVLSRDEVAEDVKSLLQEQRAGLRKHGVRFGAFHVFVPSLLKPGPTALRLLLWALMLEKHQQYERSRLPEPPGQGLTSVPFDRTTPHGYYRVVGFRVCGPRAVRIDMLERLGDLIRERVFWKPRFDGEPRPAGSVEGGGFTVVPDMMSLVGCSGEEFTAILRSLGFRMMRRPSPEPAPQPSDQEKPSETSSEVPFPAPSAIAESAAPNADKQQDEQPAPEAALKQSPMELEVWWPKDTGPFRRQHHHRRPKEKTRKTTVVAPQHSEQQEPAKRTPRKSRSPAPAPNPDSPFAILSSLRSQLVDKKNA
jgi:ATP-dependent RNA helicase SUPV3L1/SUV3